MKDTLLDVATSAVGKAISGKSASGRREKATKDGESGATLTPAAPKVLMGKAQGGRSQQQSDGQHRGGGGSSGPDKHQGSRDHPQPGSSQATRQPSAKEPRQPRDHGGGGQRGGGASGKDAAESGGNRSGSTGAAATGDRPVSGHVATGERRPKQEGAVGRTALSRLGRDRGAGGDRADGVPSSGNLSFAASQASAAVTALLQGPLKAGHSGGRGGGGGGGSGAGVGGAPPDGTGGARDLSGRKVRSGFQAYVPRARPAAGDEGGHQG